MATSLIIAFFAAKAASRAGGVIEAVVTLPPEPGPMGRRVSPSVTLTLASGMPSSSATTCASGVRMPPPMSCTPVKSSTVPSRWMRTSQLESSLHR